MNAMTFEQRMIPPLVGLAHKLLDAGLFGYIEPIGNFLVAVKSGRWRQLPDDEKNYWLDRLGTTLGPRGLGDSWDRNDPDYKEIGELVYNELKVLRR